MKEFLEVMSLLVFAMIFGMMAVILVAVGMNII